jgi:hypothetical protein
VRGGQLRPKAAGYASDPRPLDATCTCSVCKRFSRAHLHNLARTSDSAAPQLLTHHNIAYMLELCRRMREAIIAGPDAYTAFVREFLSEYFAPEGRERMPRWAADALEYAGVDIGDELRSLVVSDPKAAEPDTAALPVVTPDWRPIPSRAEASAAVADVSASGADASTHVTAASAASSSSSSSVAAEQAPGTPSKRDRSALDDEAAGAARK